MRKLYILSVLCLLAGRVCAQQPVSYSVENDITHGFLNDFSYDSVSLNVSYVMDYFNKPHNYRLDAPSPVRLTWEHQDGADAQRVEVSENQDYSDSLVFTINKDSAGYDLYNMIPGRKYYYRIMSVKADVATKVSEGELEPYGKVRWILAQGTWNVRDMGGWIGLGGHPIKYGQIFRGAQLVSPKSPYPVLITESGKEAMRNAGIRAELDLRSASQAPGTVSSLSVNGDVDYLVVPESSGARMCNFDKTEVTIRELQWIIDELRAGKPVFYHCQNGADRTGTMGFLIGALLGMGESDLAKDYELTTFCEVDAAKFDPTEAGFARLRNYEGKKGSPIGYGDNADEYKYAKLVEKMRSVTPKDANYQRKIYNWFKNGKNGVSISEEDLDWFIKEMVDYVLVKSINYSGQTSLKLNPGETYSLNATVSPADATQQNITYTSSDEAVATVSDQGVITALRGSSKEIVITMSADGLTKTVSVTVTPVESDMPAYALYKNTQCTITKNRIVNGSFEYANPFYNWKNANGAEVSTDCFDVKAYGTGDSVYIESKVIGADENADGSLRTSWNISKNKVYLFGYKVKNSTDIPTANNQNLKAMIITRNSTDESTAQILEYPFVNGVVSTDQYPSYDGEWTEIQYVFNSGNFNSCRVVFSQMSTAGNNTCIDNFYLAEVDTSAASVKSIMAGGAKGKVYDINGREVDLNSRGLKIIDGTKVLISE